MTQASRRIERASLSVGVIGNVLGAVAGIAVFQMSRSEALLLDGLYSAVMCGTGLVAMQVSANAVRPPTRAYPYGYAGQETLYVLFRSLVLIGVIGVAVVQASLAILSHLRGAPAEPLVLTPVAWYVVWMSALCLGLAWRHRRDWILTRRRSEVLRSEYQAAVLDLKLTLAAGLALLSAPLLETTVLAPLVPILDPLLVLVLALAVIRDPLLTFQAAISEAAGAACAPELIAQVRSGIEELLSTMSVRLLDLTVMKTGRTYLAVVYVHPEGPLDAAAFDHLRERVQERCQALLSSLLFCEVIPTAQPPFVPAEDDG
ncbi:cation transporter [Cyanobium sp. CH-040]|uniref:cation transporter n=1 Tax=Cyanobium sp. CH-040 TaxID=2823708 RepID=UPI0020CD85E1|nr:cation transporter [Cyanobium sp. CH-040]MCP9927648.1 cation transporter [Cyanobium sp. CH-040]